MVKSISIFLWIRNTNKLSMFVHFECWCWQLAITFPKKCITILIMLPRCSHVKVRVLLLFFNLIKDHQKVRTFPEMTIALLHVMLFILLDSDGNCDLAFEATWKYNEIIRSVTKLHVYILLLAWMLSCWVIYSLEQSELHMQISITVIT